MVKSAESKSAAIRARLKHPIIDADGHMIEFEPALLDHLEHVGGRSLADRFAAWVKEGLFRWHKATPEERRDRRIFRLTWWGMPAKNTLDRATASLPALLYERLDEIGIDYSVLYPTFGLPVPSIEEGDFRRGVCRGFNHFYADTFREYSDRLCPAAIIPMHSPQEAIEELDYAVKELGLKAVMCAGFVRRSIPAVARECPGAARDAYWIDTFGLDSEHDYDPFWSRCIELKINPAFHSGAFGTGARTSISNFIYNRLGMFATSGEALCKSLFMGGVTRRFPRLKFAFLEGGVAWACSLYSDLFSHWEKRNRDTIQNYNPANMDRELMNRLYREYGGRMVEGKLGELDKVLGLLYTTVEDPAMLDEWAACGIDCEEDIRDLFVPCFYFGCEADDRLNSLAFDTKLNRLGARLNAIFGSDISHWDVPDMREVVAEAYELVEEGLMTEEDFRELAFTNPARFHGEGNGDFFKGTVVESEVAKLLESRSAHP